MGKTPNLAEHAKPSTIMKGNIRLKADVGAEKPLLSHLEDLRTVLIRCFAALAVGMLAAIPLCRSIFNILKLPLIRAGRNPDVFLIPFEVTGGFSVAMRIVFWSGLLFSLPFIAVFSATFVFPGLTPKERRIVVRASAFAVALFVVGAALGYFGTLPLALNVMFGVSEWIGFSAGPVYVRNYVTFCLHLMLGFGLAFELPVLLIALARTGVLHAAQLRAVRPHVMVGLLVLAMLLTPPDIFTQLMMALPLILLYEVSIGIIAVSERRKPGGSGLA